MRPPGEVTERDMLMTFVILHTFGVWDLYTKGSITLILSCPNGIKQR